MTDFIAQGRFQVLSSLFMFHSLTDMEKNLIARRCNIRDLKRNDILYSKGDIGSEFYIIVNGSLEIFTDDKSGLNRTEVVVDIMRKGDTLGIVSILEKKPHSFSARALGDVRLYVILEDDLHFIMEKIPNFNKIITRVLSRRLKQVNAKSERKIIESQVISIYAAESEEIASKYTVELAEHILNESRKSVIVLRFNKTNKSPIRASSRVKNYSLKEPEEIVNILNKFIYSYNIILLDLPVANFEICSVLLKESDHCHYLTYSEEDFREKFIKKYNLFNEKLKNNYFRHTKISRIQTPTELNQMTRKIARELAEVRIGLALGGGAAFGLAQIGVLKVLERENIKVDMVAGTSIGSLVGAIWCSGISASDIEKSTKDISSIFNMLKFMDFSIMPKKGLISGNNIKLFLEKYLGKKSFDSLQIDMKVVACDINAREEIVIQSGNIVEAVMASTAIPGLFHPIKKNEMVLVDGGIVNPLPVSPLTIEGINRIIAVNAMPSPEDIVSSNRVDQNLMDIFINSFYSLQFRLCKYAAQSSDVYLSPILKNSSWYEFYRAKEFIDFGEKVCYENIKPIKKLARK